MPTPRVLTIAGSDSSGGAGIEADLKVIAAHKCYGMTCITALTAQNTVGVEDIHIVPAAFLAKSIAAVIEDIGVDVVKTGMLADESSIAVVVDAIKKYSLSSIVLDPVMVATSGSVLLPPAAIAALCDTLVPLATVVTPNVPEAHHMLAHYLPAAAESLQDITSMAGLVALATQLHEQTGTAVLLKGGHLPVTADGQVAHRQKDKAVVMDVLVFPDGAVKIFSSPYIDSTNTHGTGCSLASAIACNLALGLPLPAAINSARAYIVGAISASHTIGRGNGPVNHLHNVYRLPFAAGCFIDYLMEHPDVAGAWKSYVNHDFVKRIADGSIGFARFRWYLEQDYLFLTHFARATALLAYKSTTMDEISTHATAVAQIASETEFHIDYCAQFGLTERDLRAAVEAPTTTAYTRYVLDVGASGDVTTLAVALVSCAVGYQVAARNWEVDASSVRTEAGNPFWSWVEEYAGERYAAGVKVRRDMLERYARGLGLKQVEELVVIFRRVTEMERDFFTAALEVKVEESPGS
ncbi:hypothetical protein DRE_03537 [Drechslerella stenobrocha 248]|uniref:Phosphomethylpyrimidine kinase n=1 Tax=Drechslerella stenobrocha 248 TaxID=1043628 RepID=W7I4T1_9PEZI|nr:hypothetical protein DRE_03537 [Drechslerella stenobrocha 248]